MLEQNGYPVICIVRKVSKAEQGYSQALLESLVVFWAVKRLHKYLFNIDFTICTDHRALEFVYHPDKSLSKNSSAMVQRWTVALGAYRYTIEHRSVKHKQHADFLSRHSHMSPPDPSKDCLLIQPVPISRKRLIQDARRYFGVVMKSLRTGWKALTKKIYARREDLSTTPDRLLWTVIPATFTMSCA